MKKQNLKLVCMSVLAFAAASVAAQGHLSREVTSTVNIVGSTSASASGRDVLAYGQTNIAGRHVGANGATNYSGVVGAEGSGNYSTNAQTSLMFGEVRGTTVQGGLHPSHGHGNREATSYVNNAGSVSSNAYAADPKTLAWGDLRTSGTLTGPGGSAATFGQNYGYDATGTYSASGRANGYFGQNFTVRVGR